MKNLKELREESNGNTRLLYHLNYWDGPISGVMLWNGERCYFNQFSERSERIKWSDEEIEDWKKHCEENGREFDIDDCEDWDLYRHYKVYRTPPNVMRDIDEDHELFRRYVGVHTDYDENGRRCLVNHLRPAKFHKLFYDRKKENHCKMDVENWEVIGEFEY